ncbi:S4 domain protein [Oxobacter pfennigii]|uniref:S4 domain protein n=1 Tax=Oxobacter pfennigii TaxID=36849 RepID=A0A0P8W5N5_9CLOT|nr:YlmH/Sll1252 family protein [Oxobacter pfennigii]KPU43997.1 S4 domain protein [Oxobacter pfennigii]
MNKKDEILNSIKSGEDKILAVKIIDNIEQVQRYFEPRFTDFLDPAQVMKASAIIKKIGHVNYEITGGIANSERSMLVIYPGGMDFQYIKLPISALYFRGNTKFEKLEHRDILGALMSLGIKRDKIGDIILSEDLNYILVSEDISNYIKINLTKIKHVGVSAEYADLKNVPQREQNFKVIAANVASLRLDAVLSAGFGESRSSIAKEIVSQKVKVNFEEVTDLNRLIKTGDVISLKGRGRIVLERIGSKTKKDRINIIIKKII